ncbi:MAG TPA: hypothetical protein VIP05_06835 [Burkholderiaceae bacterium]
MPAPAAPARRTPPLLAAALLVVSLAYPVVVYLALGHVSPRWIALLLVALALARAWVTRESFWLVAAALALVLAAASFLGDFWGPLKLYPALVNGVMFGLFAMSLWRGPSVVERLARLRETDFPPAAVAYTRRVTQVWCGFFVVNGLIAVATALWASTAVWTLYNGLLSYVAMGALMGGEWLVRQRVRARIAAQDAARARPGASNA